MRKTRLKRLTFSRRDYAGELRAALHFGSANQASLLGSFPATDRLVQKASAVALDAPT